MAIWAGLTGRSACRRSIADAYQFGDGIATESMTSF
jgi:hypothetical protein